MYKPTLIEEIHESIGWSVCILYGAAHVNLSHRMRDARLIRKRDLIAPLAMQFAIYPVQSVQLVIDVIRGKR